MYNPVFGAKVFFWLASSTFYKALGAGLFAGIRPHLANRANHDLPPY